ncbi:SYG-like protein [Mya arenaria]|uniref:Glycine--tRNA ligase n=1 Tax=Mya arenaria TaxID=6604 RepID=A0ABY7DBC0_MYAAR|nr:SYG-like protein [Mya arenaria]
MDPAVEELLTPYRQSVKEQGDLVRKLKDEKAPDIDLQRAVAELKKRKHALTDKASMVSMTLVQWAALLRQTFYKHGEISSFSKKICWKASGHVERFQDYMVKDLKNGECFRADHLIENTFEKMLSDKKVTEDIKAEIRSILPTVDNMSKDEMGETLKRFSIKSPVTGNDISDPLEFNLMFSTAIGPTGTVKGYLRPETAQGIFVNFKRLLEFNGGKLPFGGAQIGAAFRNEISPRSGLIRVREFAMAEIEYFMDPKEKETFYKFENVRDLKVTLLSACKQMEGKAPDVKSLGDAVKDGTIANESLAYFMGRIYMFLMKVGIDNNKFRFRQHLANEMAHYACDCWDAEMKTSYGWIECVGCADRSCYDLLCHQKATGMKLGSRDNCEGPEIHFEERHDHIEEFNPSVIEPSFGIGRVMYSLFEHNFKIREGDEQRSYLSLPPIIAPYKCSVLPLSNNADLLPFDLLKHDISHKVDSSSGSIGRRYARTDAIAIPYGITVDFDTLKDPHTATLRERDTMKQIRAPLSELAEIVRDLSQQRRTWEDILNNYPIFEQQESTK